MKKSFKPVLGVTLLEIMLVLAIAAMVIVMSIRYYQSASLNQKVAATLDNLTGIVAAGESYLAANGTLATVSDTVLGPYLPGGTMPNSAWGGAMTTSAPAVNGYTVTIPSVPSGVACTQLTALIKQNPKLVPTCGATGVVVVITE